MAWLQNLTTSLLFESTNVFNSVGECQADKTYETVGLLSFQYNDNYCQNSQFEHLSVHRISHTVESYL